MRHRAARTTAIHLLWIGALLLGGCGGGEGEGDAGKTIARIQAIGERRGGSGDEIDFVTERLKNGDAEERSAAAWALGRAGGPDAIPLLQETLRGDPDLYVRVNTATALGNLGGPGTEEALVGLLSEDAVDLQAAALKALSSRRYLGAWEAVGKVLTDGPPELRPLAGDALASMQNPDSVGVLVAALGDEDKEVRKVATFALGKLADRQAVPALLPLLEDPEWDVRANAAQALGMIGDPSARPGLEAAAEDPDEQVRMAARRALGKL